MVLGHLTKRPDIDCPLDKCAGRVLRQTVIADRPFPPFDRSMMDGYALRASEIGPEGVFEVTAECPAGSARIRLHPEAKSCAEIMTGAIVPESADCVVPYEATTRLDNNRMQLIEPDAHAAGDYVHKSGSDRPAGDVLIGPGRIIGSRETAIAASCGYATLRVSKQPSIAIVSTGDELVDIAEKPAPHQIRRSNDLMLDAALERIGFNANERAHINDDSKHCTESLRRLGRENDILIISGGISMGKKDFIPEALCRLGFACHFHGVAQKPGKPFGFWTSPICAVFALPGNPISSLTCLHAYVMPALVTATGQASGPVKTSVELSTPVNARDDLTVFLPVSLDSNNLATPQPVNNSGDLVRILGSAGYIELPPTPEKTYPAGKSFDFHPWF